MIILYEINKRYTYFNEMCAIQTLGNGTIFGDSSTVPIHVQVLNNHFKVVTSLFSKHIQTHEIILLHFLKRENTINVYIYVFIVLANCIKHINVALK